MKGFALFDGCSLFIAISQNGTRAPYTVRLQVLLLEVYKEMGDKEPAGAGTCHLYLQGFIA